MSEKYEKRKNERIPVNKERVKQALKLRNISQHKLAEIIGMPVENFNYYLNQREGFSKRYLNHIAGVLNVSVDYLKGANTPKKNEIIAMHEDDESSLADIEKEYDFDDDGNLVETYWNEQYANKIEKIDDNFYKWLESFRDYYTDNNIISDPQEFFMYMDVLAACTENKEHRGLLSDLGEQVIYFSYLYVKGKLPRNYFNILKNAAASNDILGDSNMFALFTLMSKANKNEK